ncbi:MAG: transposase, partial [candidate division NC10 bacterium]
MTSQAPTLSRILCGSATFDALPQDAPLLRGLLGEALRALHERDHRIALLTHYLMRLNRWQFGVKSERIEEGQDLFAFYGKVIEAPAQDEEAVKRPSRRPSANGHGR